MAQLFKSHCHSSSRLVFTIIQQWLARLFNSGWNDCPRVTNMIVQQSPVWFNRWHDCSAVKLIIPFFYASTILKQQYLLFKNRVMYQEFDKWSTHTSHDKFVVIIFIQNLYTGIKLNTFTNLSQYFVWYFDTLPGWLGTIRVIRNMVVANPGQFVFVFCFFVVLLLYKKISYNY